MLQGSPFTACCSSPQPLDGSDTASPSAGGSAASPSHHVTEASRHYDPTNFFSSLLERRILASLYAAHGFVYTVRFWLTWTEEDLRKILWTITSEQAAVARAAESAAVTAAQP
jgi:hypothetical protein